MKNAEVSNVVVESSAAPAPPASPPATTARTALPLVAASAPAVPFKNTHLSYSRISRYEQCPRSFKLHYIDQLPSESAPELEFGKALHSVLEQLVGEHALGLEPAALSLEQAERLWQQEWSKSPLIGVGAFYEGLRILETFIRSEGVVDPASIVAVEQPFEIQIGRFKVVGAIDRVDRIGEKNILVRDYKSSRLIPTRDDLAEHLQLGIYNLVARELWPSAERIDLQLDMLRHDVRLRTSRSDAEIEAVRRYVEAIGERSEADTEYRAKPNAYCGRCEHRAQCHVYAEALAGKREIVAVNLADLEQVAREREAVARIANVAYARKKELDGILKNSLETADSLELAGMRYELQPITSKDYPIDQTVRLLQEATGLPRDTVLAKIAVVDRESLTKLLGDLGKKLPRPRVNLLRAEIEARATKAVTQRLSAKPVRA